MVNTAKLALFVIFIIHASICSSAAMAQGELIEFWDEREQTSQLKVDHSAWQNILDKYLDANHSSGINLFDYAGVSEQDKQAILDYIDFLIAFDPRQFNSDEQFAYWVNLYNAGNVMVVLTRDIQNSIREVRSGFFSRGPWGLDLFEINTKELSLDDIEHGILRPIWKDPRIHYVVNCASLSCPDLQPQALTAANYEQVLEAAAKKYINHPRALTINNDEIVLSSIYDWYGDDFGKDFSGLVDHLSEYLEPQKLAQLNAALDKDVDIEYEYDWSLNRPDA